MTTNRTSNNAGMTLAPLSALSPDSPRNVLMIGHQDGYWSLCKFTIFNIFGYKFT